MNLLNLNWISKIRSFLLDVRREMDKVSWPSRDEVITMTILIIGMVIVLSAYIGGVLDTVFRQIIRQLLEVNL